MDRYDAKRVTVSILHLNRVQKFLLAMVSYATVPREEIDVLRHRQTHVLLNQLDHDFLYKVNCIRKF